MTTTSNLEDSIDGGSEKSESLGIYIHIPFCLKKCAYCDFLSFEDSQVCDNDKKKYVEAVINEIKVRAKLINAGIVDTVFIGGGTPSILEPSLISDIIEAVKSSFHMAGNSKSDKNFETDSNIEITIEANPKTLTEAKLRSYIKSGINRISIGAQSFDDGLLNTLGRAHSAEDIKQTFNMARDAGFKNINLDLMFAISGQSMEIWEDTLSKAIELDPEHISLYGLSIEERTPFYEMFKEGRFEQVSDELDRKMYHMAIKRLLEAGYVHYEISNVCKPSYECKHNIKYWTMRNYLGIGIGAHSFYYRQKFEDFFDKTRSANVVDLDAYIEINSQYTDDRDAKAALMLVPKLCGVWTDEFGGILHSNSESDNISEYMFTGLRLINGVSLEDFEARFERPLHEVYAEEWQAIEKYVEDGFLIIENGNIRLSQKGIDISNKIMSEFVL